MGKRSIYVIGAAALLAALAVAQDRGAPQWRTPAPRSAAPAAAPTIGEHAVVQFDQPLTPARRGRVAIDGWKLLRPLGASAYFAVRTESPAAPAVGAPLPRFEVSAITTNMKLHPALADGGVPAWAALPAQVEESEGPVPAAPASPQLALYVLFHADVALPTTAAQTLGVHGAWVRSWLELVNGAVVEMPADAVAALAAEDSVSWIEPALPPLAMVNDENRASVGIDLLQAPPYGLSGAGVNVMVYDGGTARPTHVDFSGRLTVYDDAPLQNHSTHVAGTIGGDGTASGGLYRGMAPAATLLSYGYQPDGGGVLLYTDPGDLEADYRDAFILRGAQIANNSIGSNVEINGFACSIQGDYGVTSAMIDAIAAGGLLTNAPIVWAAGNERGGQRCDVEGFGDYYSIAPPAGAKNSIVVGALNADDGTMTSFSGWGPTDDGRLKPDICGPGSQTGGDGGVTSTSSTSDTDYTVLRGTSMAAPTVTGLLTLLIEDHRLRRPDAPDPSSALLKALLIHTAEDRHTVGPDYRTGYGAVQGVAALDALRGDQYFEGDVDQDQTARTLVMAEAGATVRVTLVWNDPPGVPNVSPALVNDLDLVVIDPAGGRHYPWTLDPLQPGAAATRTTSDHINNVEQVVIDDAAPGLYQVEVIGFELPAGPQAFALAASPVLLGCSSQGVAGWDRAVYTCASNAHIEVTDCDLNQSDETIDQVVVNVRSSSDVHGEHIALLETGPATAKFSGLVPLRGVDSAGAVRVADGDTVTLTYIDADDGAGGVGVPMVATATVDCVPATTLDVVISGVQPDGATVTVQTDEPALVSLQLGNACGGPYQTVRSIAGYDTVHVFALNGLGDLTTYAFEVDVTDAAGNVFVDDHGGSCFTFTTPRQPQYFTELFENAAPIDLAFTQLRWLPDGAIDGYVACARDADALPHDPKAGTALALEDDDAAYVALTGGARVELYGRRYAGFWVGSNGYLTFDWADDTFLEQAAAHFDQARVSVLFDDLSPGGDAQVTWQQLADRVVVSWSELPEFALGGANTFQVELHFDGQIVMTYGELSVSDGLVGLSAGGGEPEQFAYSDLSESGACCGPDARLMFTRPSYACVDEAVLRLIDCDLNVDPHGIDTAQATLVSTLMPVGVPIVLTETEPNSAWFEGTVSLSDKPQSGQLLVNDGAVVRAMHNTTSESGAAQPLVTAEAVIDCTPPQITSIRVTDIRSYRTTVAVSTNEPAAATVRYGLSCAQLVNSAQSVDLSYESDVLVSGLLAETTYRYAVSVADAVGNTSTSVQSPCPTFTTGAPPNRYTEQFLNADNDLQYVQLRFVPDSSASSYHACRVPIDALPTDPKGGAPLVLADDSFAGFLLSGVAVPFYGQEWTQLYIGSNGYITFGNGDVDQTESLEDHFAMPRVSVLFDDLDPELGGEISVKLLADRLVITYLGVHEFGGDENTFQTELYFDGRITLNYLDISVTDGLVGLSDGGGLSVDFAPTDLSAQGSCGSDILGDVNCDGVLDTYDIDAFALAITSPVAYANAYPQCDRALADCDGDGRADTYDIDCFVSLLQSR